MIFYKYVEVLGWSVSDFPMRIDFAPFGFLQRLVIYLENFRSTDSIEANDTRHLLSP